MNWRFGVLLAILLVCVAATAVVIMNYSAAPDEDNWSVQADFRAKSKSRMWDLVQEQRYAEAERIISSYLKAVTDDVGMRCLLSKVMYKSGNYSGAIKTCYAVLLKNPRDFIARNNLGVALAKSNRLGEAERELEDAFEFSDGEGFIGLNLGRIYVLRGKYSEAQLLFETVMEELHQERRVYIPDSVVMLDGVAPCDMKKNRTKIKEKE